MQTVLDVVPHGDDFDAPLSTYAQDVGACTYAALACIANDWETGWLDSVFSPLRIAEALSDFGLLDVGSSTLAKAWRERLHAKPHIAAAVKFVSDALTTLADSENITANLVDDLMKRSSVLLP